MSEDGEGVNLRKIFPKDLQNSEKVVQKYWKSSAFRFGILEPLTQSTQKSLKFCQNTVPNNIKNIVKIVHKSCQNFSNVGIIERIVRIISKISLKLI